MNSEIADHLSDELDKNYPAHSRFILNTSLRDKRWTL